MVIVMIILVPVPVPRLAAQKVLLNLLLCNVFYSTFTQQTGRKYMNSSESLLYNSRQNNSRPDETIFDHQYLFKPLVTELLDLWHCGFWALTCGF